MNRLTKELQSRGLIYEPDEVDIILKGMSYDNSQTLVDITSEFVICLWSSAVMEPILRLYDRKTLKEIGEQNLFPERTFGGSRTWGAHVTL